MGPTPFMSKLMSDLEQRMKSLCAGSAHSSDSCVAAIHGHLDAGGARLRAQICLDAGLRLKLSAADAIQLAACCELLHNASLIHDDLIDRTAMRRGHPCVWVEYGDTVAICAGDLMLSSAYAALVSISKPGLIPSVLARVHMRAREVMLGQVAESTRTASTHPFDDYQRLAIGKSASLLSLSLELPLLLAGREDAFPIAQAATTQFAVAYQIADDLIDQVEDAREGSLNMVSLLQQASGLSRTEAEHAAATRALAALSEAVATGTTLPSGCAAALIASAESLQVRLSAVAPGSSLLVSSSR